MSRSIFERQLNNNAWRRLSSGAVAILVAVAALCLGSPEASAAGWAKYKAKKYGFSMLVPKGTKFKLQKEYAKGWAALVASHKGVKLYAVGRLGKPAKAKDIEKYGVKVTGVPNSAWKQIDKGSGKGWKWYRTVKATKGGKVLYGGYGVGKRGSYMLVLSTTTADFKAHKADYLKWYKSIRLF